MIIDFELSHYCRVKDHIWNSPDYRPLEGEATHQWEFFIRDRESEKMSYIEKVVVILHDTFPEPRRGMLLLTLPLSGSLSAFATVPVLYISADETTVRRQGGGLC